MSTAANSGDGVEILIVKDDRYEEVVVEIEKTIIVDVFVASLMASISKWRGQWMPLEEYALQPFVQTHEMAKVTEIILAKAESRYTGFTLVTGHSSFSGDANSLYLNKELNSSVNSSCNDLVPDVIIIPVDG